MFLKSFHRGAWILALSVLFASAAEAQIRSYVGIVRGQFSPDFVKKMEACREELRGKGYISYANAIDSYLKGGFGSGFVYAADEGVKYVLTNRHVVMEAEEASITFETQDGTQQTQGGLKVIAVNEEIDMALLAFPAGKEPGSGLAFSKSPVKDGQEVWSAGFPGLGGEPVWQLGKGTVTNSSARIKELIDPAVSTVIQHSAEIDRGNSGGPLLTASSNSIGYDVAGVNTWKAAYRQNTNFAVPAEAILVWIQDFRNESDESEEKAVRGRAREFISALSGGGSDFAPVARLVSLEMALSSGAQDFVSAMKFAPSDTRNRIAWEFEQAPADGFRYACAYSICQKYGPAENGEAPEIVSAEKKSGGWEISLASPYGTEIKTVWKKDGGSWKISLMSNAGEESGKAESKKKTTRKYLGSDLSGFDTPSTVDISAGGELITSDTGGGGFCAGVDVWTFANGYAGLGFMFEHFSAGDSNMNLGGMCTAARLPYNIPGGINIAIVGRAGVNVLGYDSDLLLGYYIEPAFEVLYTAFKARPGLGVAMRFAGSLMDLSNSNDLTGLPKSFSSSALKIYAKVAF